MLTWITHNRLYDLARRGRRLTPWWALLPLAWLMLLLAQVLGLPAALLLFAAEGAGEAAAPVAASPALSGLLYGLLLALSFGGMILLVWLWVRLYEKRGFATLGFEREGALQQYGRGLVIGFLAFAGAVGLMAVSELLKPTGRAYFAVRRDIKRSGFRIHAKHGVPVYQCNVGLPYRSILQVPHCEIYEYRHLNQQALPPGECPFCAPEPERELLTESATAYALLDKYPVSPGHALVIPKQHAADYFALSSKAKTACWMVVDRVKWLLDERYHPDGYNVGINVGSAAGQTVPHVHIHVIPRYAGDVENPTGGVRNVIPGRGDYIHETRKTSAESLNTL